MFVCFTHRLIEKDCFLLFRWISAKQLNQRLICFSVTQVVGTYDLQCYFYFFFQSLNVQSCLQKHILTLRKHQSAFKKFANVFFRAVVVETDNLTEDVHKIIEIAHECVCVYVNKNPAIFSPDCPDSDGGI